MKPEVLPIIAVIGSGTQSHREYSFPLGKWLAQNGFQLINGGGGGVMAETARAFIAVEHRKGKVIGILPAKASCESQKERENYQSPPGYPNAFTEIILRTHLPDSGSQGKRVSSRTTSSFYRQISLSLCPAAPAPAPKSNWHLNTKNASSS